MQADLAILECVVAGAGLMYLCTQPDASWNSTAYVLICLWVIFNSYARARKKRV